MVYLTVEDLTKYYGEVLMFDNITFTIEEGKKVALIARNGTGKTTLLNIIYGKDIPDNGTVTINKDIAFSYLEQNPDFDETKTILEIVFSSSGEVSNAIMEYEQAITRDDKDALQKAIDKMDRHNAWDYEYKAKQILSQLKIDDFNKNVKQLSGGQRKRVALAYTLINEPDFLILDEPTNHLDLEMIEWLEGYLSKMKCTLFMVTHDRYFLDRVCDEIIELDNNVIYKYTGNYQYFLEKRSERLQVHAANVEKAKNLYSKELEWMRRQPQARATKAKARIDAFYDLKDKAFQSKNDNEVDIDINTTRLGKKILEFENINKSFGDLVLLKDFSYTFKKNDKIGIVGKNGVGKSTFLNIITRNLDQDSGTVSVGDTVVYGYYKQEGIKIDETKRVIDVIKEISEVVSLGNGKTLSASQFLEMFLFTPKMQFLQVGLLSGGEKRRLYLMTVLITNPNFLILDEPTNDLDIQTLNVLEEYLRSFGGCLIIVSHDRYFMDKVVGHLFCFEGNGVIKNYPGNYTDYRDYLNEKEKEVKSQDKEVKEEPKKKEKTKSKKLSYKFQIEYDNLEKEIENLEKEKSEIENDLSSPSMSQEEIIVKSNRLGEIDELLDEKTMRWMELAEMGE